MLFRSLLSGIEKGRTVTFRNDLNPEWDEVLYVPIHSPRDRLALEVMDTEKMGKDRSLGLVEVFAGDYVRQEGTDGEYLPNDDKTVREHGLRLHGKGIAKGVLHYTASFYPCVNVADPEDEEDEEAEKTTENKEETSADAPKASLDKARSSLDKTRASLDAPGRPSVESTGPPKVRLSPEELLRYESGLLIFRLMEADMPESHSQLEIFVDDYAYPSYTTATAATKTHKFDEIGDCMIRELDFSRLTLKARKKGDDDEQVLASLSGNTADTLKQCLVSANVKRIHCK